LRDPGCVDKRKYERRKPQDYQYRMRGLAGVRKGKCSRRQIRARHGDCGS
jgi:hypothetical protein